MKVFISWSGQASKDVAEALRNWLPPLVQSADFWMSSQDIGSGTRWFTEISGQLEQTNFGIVCITPENKDAPWLMFEAGALAKRLDLGRVVPLCIGLKPAELKPPLGMFNGIQLTTQAMRELVITLNGESDKPISRQGIESLVEAMLPVFMDRIKPTLDAARKTSTAPAPSPTEEKISELTNVVRDLQWQLEQQSLQQLHGASRWQMLRDPHRPSMFAQPARVVIEPKDEDEENPPSQEK